MLRVSNFAPTSQALNTNSQRQGLTIKNTRRLDQTFNFAKKNTSGETSNLITDIENALIDLRANETEEYKLFQLIIQNREGGVYATLRKPLDTSRFTNFLEVQLKPENASTYDGNLLEYLRDALYGVLAEYRKHCPKPIENIEAPAVFA
jgi:hypothetical protein